MMKHIFEDALIAAGGISLAAVVGVGAWKVGWKGATLAIGGAAAICMIWNACIMKRDAKREAAKILTVTSELLLKDHDALSRMITNAE